MKFGRNQPHSQPIVRVARRQAIPICLPRNPPLTRPALAHWTVTLRASSQEGEDDNELDVSAHIPVEACEGGMPEVLSSAIARSQPLRA
jgi:hypothetical protein